MGGLFEEYRWVVWRRFEKEIIKLYPHFDKTDWDYIRSAIDSWIDVHFDEWISYAEQNYVRPAATAMANSVKPRADLD